MKVAKKIVIVVLLITFIALGAKTCLASGVIFDFTPDNDYSNIDGTNDLLKTGRGIIKIVRYITIIAAIILISIFGVKFILGSAEEKAEYKKSFVPLIIGILVVFGSTFIVQMILSITPQESNGNSGGIYAECEHTYIYTAEYCVCSLCGTIHNHEYRPNTEENGCICRYCGHTKNHTYDLEIDGSSRCSTCGKIGRGNPYNI